MNARASVKRPPSPPPNDSHARPCSARGGPWPLANSWRGILEISSAGIGRGILGKSEKGRQHFPLVGERTEGEGEQSTECALRLGQSAGQGREWFPALTPRSGGRSRAALFVDGPPSPRPSPQGEGAAMRASI